MKNKRLDFIMVGAAKCGTTSIFKYLEQHPGIDLPINKEPEYFIHKIITKSHKGLLNRTRYQKNLVQTHTEYKSLYQNCEGITGEGSTQYLYYAQEAIKNIKKHNPNTKIIIVLRDPVERTASAYKHIVSIHNEKRHILEIIYHEAELIEKGYHPLWHIIQGSRYELTLPKYIEAFQQVLLVQYEQLLIEPQGVMNKIFDFLEVESHAINTGKKYNVSTNVSGFIKKMRANAFLWSIYGSLPVSLKKSLTKIAFKYFTKGKIIIKDSEKIIIRKKLDETYEFSKKELVKYGFNLDLRKKTS